MNKILILGLVCIININRINSGCCCEAAEAINNVCFSNEDCKGKRQCNDLGYCEGRSYCMDEQILNKC